MVNFYSSYGRSGRSGQKKPDALPPGGNLPDPLDDEEQHRFRQYKMRTKSAARQIDHTRQRRIPIF